MSSISQSIIPLREKPLIQLFAFKSLTVWQTMWHIWSTGFPLVTVVNRYILTESQSGPRCLHWHWNKTQFLASVFHMLIHLWVQSRLYLKFLNKTLLIIKILQFLLLGKGNDRWEKFGILVLTVQRGLF